MLFIKSGLIGILLMVNAAYSQHEGQSKILSPKCAENRHVLAHRFRLQDGSCILRSPETPDEWCAYHRIRQAEIVSRYCPADYQYDYNDPEEQLKTNFPFILVDHTLPEEKAIGVIRVDLLKDNESSVRWVAIACDFQGKGYGKKMLALAEKFAKSQNRNLVRVPAEEKSRKFYEKRGYEASKWPDAPVGSGDILLAKTLQ